MKLGVASICSHLYHQGRWWSYEPFVLEMNVWADLFDELVLVAPLESGPPPPFWAPYQASARVSVIPYRKDQGSGLEQTRTSLAEVPGMVAAMFKAARQTDAFHVRGPGSIGLVSALMAPLLHERICAKYAGQWSGYPGEPASYRLQRAILGSRWFRGPVTVYGRWPDQPPHVIPFFTSVLTADQVARARVSASQKTPGQPLRLLFVGRLSAAKNVDVLLKAAARLNLQHLPVECTIVGDGPRREALEELAKQPGLNGMVRFTGGLDFASVLDYYEGADVLVLASETEGWPKAIAEGMAFGLVCIGSNRGLVPEMLGEGRGLLVEPGDVDGLVDAIRRLAIAPEEFGEMRARAAAWGQRYSLDGLRDALRELLGNWWGIPIGNTGIPDGS